MEVILGKIRYAAQSLKRKLFVEMALDIVANLRHGFLRCRALHRSRSLTSVQVIHLHKTHCDAWMGGAS